MSFDFVNRQFEIGYGSRLAVVARDRSYTWSELREKVEALEARIAGFGLAPGEPVVIRGQKEADFVVSILACIKGQWPYIPLDRIIPVERVERILDIVGSRLVLQCGDVESLSVESQLKVSDLSVTGMTELPKRQVSLGKDPLVYVIFTSGSTGEPKGVRITHKNVLDLLDWVKREDFSFSSGDVLINQCSFSFDVSFFDLLATMHHGATLILNAPEQIKVPGEIRSRIAPLNPTVWVSTPSFLSLALLNSEFNSSALPQLQKFYLAGEILHPSLVNRVREKFPSARIFNAYGPTEATVIVTMVEATPELMSRYSVLPIGYVKMGSRIDLMDVFESEGHQVGELVIVGDNVAEGYFGQPELTAKKFLQVDGQKAYRTGDHGYYQDGMVFFIGRIDNQIKLHGFRIELDEIDSHIMNVPWVERSITVPLVRDGDVKRLVAFVKLREPRDEKSAIDEVKKFLEARLPYYMIPAAFKIVSDYPYGASFKVDKKKLLETL